VAVGLVTAILSVALVWVCRKKRRRLDEEKPEGSPQTIARSRSDSQTVSRSTSLLHLLGRRERNRQEEVNRAPIGEHRLSRSPTELVIPVVDQRLNPQSMIIRFEDNDSHISFRDEDDYSRRVWRVTNASDSDSLTSTEAERRS
jgi:hypothetical protein